MKALSTTILIVVTAIVILVAALVVLTIFGGGIGQVSSLTNFQNQCRIQCAVTCKIDGVSLPPTWKTNIKLSDGTTTNCETAVGNSCAACGGTSSTTNPPSATDCSTYNGNAAGCTAAKCAMCSGGLCKPSC
jgi:hypothetical protein